MNAPVFTWRILNQTKQMFIFNTAIEKHVLTLEMCVEMNEYRIIGGHIEFYDCFVWIFYSINSRMNTYANDYQWKIVASFIALKTKVHEMILYGKLNIFLKLFLLCNENIDHMYVAMQTVILKT